MKRKRKLVARPTDMTRLEALMGDGTWVCGDDVEEAFAYSGLSDQLSPHAVYPNDRSKSSERAGDAAMLHTCKRFSAANGRPVKPVRTVLAEEFVVASYDSD